MKRIGTIKFAQDYESLLKTCGPLQFKESLITIILDYLTHYSLSETNYAMDNIKEYFHPEFIQIYDSLVNYYPQVIISVRNLYQVINNKSKSNNDSFERDFLLTDSDLIEIDKKYNDKLLLLFLNCIKEQINYKEFTESIISLNTDLTIFASIIAKTIIAFNRRYSSLWNSQIGGIKYYEYVKSYSCNRRFCKVNSGKHFHINKIMKMDNKEIGPVIFFGGGLGCTHFFEADPFYKRNKV